MRCPCVPLILIKGKSAAKVIYTFSKNEATCWDIRENFVALSSDEGTGLLWFKWCCVKWYLINLKQVVVCSLEEDSSICSRFLSVFSLSKIWKSGLLGQKRQFCSTMWCWPGCYDLNDVSNDVGWYLMNLEQVVVYRLEDIPSHKFWKCIHLAIHLSMYEVCFRNRICMSWWCFNVIS